MSTLHIKSNKNSSAIVLQETIINLLKKHSFKKVTVNKICETAKISRASFYSNFDDKYDLLRSSLENMKSELFDGDNEGLDEASLLSILRTIRANGDFLKNMLTDDINHELISILSRVFVNKIANNLSRSSKTFSISPDFLAVYAAGGCAYTLLSWIVAEYTISEEEMASRLVKMLDLTLK